MEAIIYGSASAEVQSALQRFSGQPIIDHDSGLFSLDGLEPDAICPLVDAGILIPQSDTSATVGPASALISDDLYQQWQLEIAPLSTAYTHALMQHLPDLDSWLAAKPPCSWLKWTALAGWLIDIEVNRIAAEANYFGHESDLQVWIQPYDHTLPNFGVRIQVNEQVPAVFGELWLSGIRKTPPLPLNIGPAGIATMVDTTAGNPVAGPALGICYYLQIVAGPRNRPEIACPVINPCDWPSYKATFTRAATDIARATLLSPAASPHHPPYGNPAAYKHAYARLLMRTAASRINATGILSDAPATTSAAWGTWLAIGEQALQLFAPNFRRDDTCSA